MHNRLIIDSLSSHLAVLDADGIIIQVNKAWKEFGECSNLKLHNSGVGTNYLEVVEKSAEDDQSITDILDGLQKVIQGKSPSFECDYPCHSPDGQRWFTLQATPMESKKGTVITHTNVTLRYLAEKDLRLSENRLKLATKSAQIGVWDWDVVNNVLVWDDSMYELYGVNKKDFSGAYDAWEKTLHPDDKEKASHEVELALQDVKQLDTVFRILINDSIRFITAKAEVKFDNDGQAIRMTGVNMDITDEKNLEREKLRLMFMAQERERNRVSHDLHDGLGQSIAAASL